MFSDLDPKRGAHDRRIVLFALLDCPDRLTSPNTMTVKKLLKKAAAV